MQLPKNREYKLKFYLNAKHYIIIGSEQGEIHPHTWEIQLHFGLPKSLFIEFTTIEKKIDSYFQKYQNRILNEVEPFDSIIPTLENMTDYFTEKCAEIIESVGGFLYSVETAETPTRSYCVTLDKPNNDYEIETIVDGIVKQHG